MSPNHVTKHAAAQKNRSWAGPCRCLAGLLAAIMCLVLLPGAMAQSSDYGDAPEPAYPTSQVNDGARHVLGSRAYLGQCVDSEDDGLPSAEADGDDITVGGVVWGDCEGDDDEDGVNFPNLLAVGAETTIEVFAAFECTLSAWIDFAGDGDWDDPEDELFPGGEYLTAGVNELTFMIPGSATEGTTWARFRCTSDGPVTYTGEASDGEVEDYQLSLGLPADYGDAPDPSYLTLKANDGAKHVLVGSDVYLGSCVDADDDGRPTATADGDDTFGGYPQIGGCTANDDEDGVNFTSELIAGTTATVDVEASAACTLSAWVDFNADGDWDEADDELFPGGQSLAAGINSLSFDVPSGAVAGLTFSRFRCTTDGAVSYNGSASDGEVEDHPVIIDAVSDFGDAPDPSYPTLSASSGASHTLGGDVYLGSCVDADIDGQTSGGGDDRAAGNPVFGSCEYNDDDEDGVNFTSPLVAGMSASIDVEANADCTLSAWIDFDANGDWSDTGEDIFPGGTALIAGVNSLSFDVPAGAPSGYTYARFRCTTDGAVGFTGAASDGEVEDYGVYISDIDFGDAPDPTYPTLQASDGAMHRIGGSVYLGSCVDGELDGLQSAAADGDDTAVGDPVVGVCNGDDDEDGVTFLTPLYPDGSAEIQVWANDGCTLSAWIDFNADGDWDEGDEEIFPGGTDVSRGSSFLSFSIPAGAVIGTTHARFRCTTEGAVSYTGFAGNGEVEDYQVTIETPRDWGDWQYISLLAEDGARHIMGSGVYLGACVDAELDGQPSPSADADDLIGSPRVDGTCSVGDDEDGVVFTSLLLPSTTATVDVTASAACTLSAWIDFNGNFEWIDSGEELFPGGVVLSAGVNSLSFSVPASVANTGMNSARFRCTTDGAVAYTGEASDGEVEDYLVLVDEVEDFGDAPDPGFPTLAASSGASHVLGSGVFLGACVDPETDGQPSEGAVGDDTLTGSPYFGSCIGSDEDGVVVTSALVPGRDGYIDVTASAACTLSAWIDFNGDGDWDDTGELLYPGGQALIAGVNNLAVPVPADATIGSAYARFRCTTDGAVGYSGQASDGEVEDYQLLITNIEDWGDAPAPYPTTAAENGANHLLTGSRSVLLGSCIDGDSNGLPTANATGDDLAPGYPVYGSCNGDDDEDGVIFAGSLLPGSTAELQVTAGGACTLSAWIDFNADGDWDDTDEELFPGGQIIAGGINQLSITVPAGAVVGSTYARFRCTTDGAVGYLGQASDGEVEDYQVTIGTAIDYGDAPDPTYPTTAASSGASHILTDGVYLGACVDAEEDGLQSADINGDDINGGNPVFGTCTGIGDEDGVTFLTPLAAGETAEIEVSSIGACTLSAWIDFNADGDWDDAGEAIFPAGAAVIPDRVTLSFDVPATAVSGTTVARFRCTTDGVVSYTGQASDGEVEDYEVAISYLDYGDAPDPAYSTLLASDGARHQIRNQVYLGACIDGEADGQPTTAANGDDTAGGFPEVGDCTAGDDEDGVSFTDDLIIGNTVWFDVQASASCTLSAWIDFNADGDWDDSGEDLFPGGQPVVMGANSLSLVVPPNAVAGDTYARFRCTTDGPMTVTGVASDGEVEDYLVELRPAADYGDAPDPTYPTLFASDGARHLLGSNVFLGYCVDSETDGQPTTAADGDDLNPGDPVIGTCGGTSKATGNRKCLTEDDEDGVIFTSLLLTDSTANVDIRASAACTLSAWIDFNADGDWDEVDDELFPGGTALVAGVNSLSFSVPAGAVEGATYARFRCTTDGAVSYTGEASDGEVEDYQVVVGPAADWGDAIDPTYPTLSASTGASHLLGSDVYLGACVDVELDGYQSVLADGDDLAAGAQVFGTCSASDDEDGVVFTSLIIAGASVSFDVTASVACTLSAWIDFNGDGDWDETDDELFPGGTALIAGVNNLSITAPASVTTGTSMARFRCTTDGAVSYTGQASDGEVEDYQVIIGEAWDWGDAPTKYPTDISDNGATHLLGSGVFLGGCVDTELDGNPSAAADGDDLTAGNPVFGTCTDGDDEDGVVFTSEPVPGQGAGVDVTASAACTLSAWIDFNGDGDWDDTGEDLFPGGQALSAGVNSLVYSVPEEAEVIGNVFARFRCTTDGAVAPTGAASDGEVEDHVVTVPPPTADLSITKTDGVVTAAPGGSVTYTIVAGNAGPYSVIGGKVIDAFPTGFSCSWTCVGAGGAVCTAGPIGGDILDSVDIPVGGTATYTATCTIPSSATGTIVNTASVSAPGYTDPNAANDSATDDDTVLVPEADLEISKVDDPDPVVSGDYLTYTVTVLNNGPSDAENVVVTDTLPAEATFVSSSGCAEDPDGYTDCTLGTIAAGASVQYTITAGIALDTSGTITNNASVSSTTADPNGANDSTSEDTNVLDQDPPEVTITDSVAGTGDGQLDECETVIGAVTQLLVTFSEAMNDPAGDSDPDDVTNPSNYLIVSAGADLILDTTVCGTAAGDDVEVTIAGVTYDAPTTTATVTLGMPLGPARHRLLVCGSTSVTDLSGNPLDGNGDGTGGDDFARTFRADPNNLLVNAHFDCDLASWTVTSATPGEIEHSTLDFDGSVESGSVHMQQLALDNDFEISQCVGAYASMIVGGRIQISAAAFDYLSYTRSCEFFDQPDCTGNSLTVGQTTLILGDTAGDWLNFENTVIAPVGTSSALCSFEITAPAGEDFDVWLDNLVLTPGAILIFSDGFESGDTSAWSSTN
jgi:uncharacterized repeat protein (TIGR01451 family)